MREIRVGDLFEVERGKSRYTRAYLESNPGPFPSYSAALFEPLGFGKDSDYEGPLLSFTMNGYAGRTSVLSGKFSVNADRGVLIPKFDIAPDLRFLSHTLQPVLVGLAVGRRVDGLKNEYTKISAETVEEAVIQLPTKANDELDFEAMSAMGRRLARSDKLQKELAERLDAIMGSNVLVECEAPFVDIALGDESYFGLSIGKRVLMSDFVSEGIPVYSASVRKEYGRVQQTNLANFDTPSLLWGIDWKFDWNLVAPHQTFATTDHCGRVTVESENLDPEYLLHQLRATREEYGFDRVYRANLKNVRDVVVRVPTNIGGEPDISRQKQLAQSYSRIEKLRFGVKASIESILESTIDPQLDEPLGGA
jgi:hypothetical protein